MEHLKYEELTDKRPGVQHPNVNADNFEPFDEKDQTVEFSMNWMTDNPEPEDIY